MGKSGCCRWFGTPPEAILKFPKECQKKGMFPGVAIWKLTPKANKYAFLHFGYNFNDYWCAWKPPGSVVTCGKSPKNGGVTLYALEFADESYHKDYMKRGWGRLVSYPPVAQVLRNETVVKSMTHLYPSWLCEKHVKSFLDLATPPTPAQTKERHYRDACNKEQAVLDAIGRTWEWWKQTHGCTPSNIPSVIFQEARLGPISHVYLGETLDESVEDLRMMLKKATASRRRAQTIWKKALAEEKGGETA